MEVNIHKTEKFAEGEYIVCLSKVYDPGIFGFLFPPQVPGTYNDLKLFGVFRIDPHNSYTGWGINFKVRLMPMGHFKEIMHLNDYYTTDIMSLVVDSENFVGYEKFYHFTDPLWADKFAKEMNAKLLNSFYFHHYLTEESRLAEGVAKKTYNDLCTIINGVSFNNALKKLSGYNHSKLNLYNEEDEVLEEQGNEFFDCNFDDITARIIKTDDGFCYVSSLVEVWNDTRTKSISIMVG